MDQRLYDVLHGQTDNYLLPFYWQRGNHRERIPHQIQRIYESGCRAFCVESRPHLEFADTGWWADMDVILAEAEKRGMRVWVLDDDTFPTGHAAGWIKNKYPELRQWNLIEEHIDVVGPAREQAIMCNIDEENILLAAYAYSRYPGYSEACQYEAIDLTANVRGNYLYWDVPDGVWRIFFYFKSRQGASDGYVDSINPDSVRVLIDAVYETHYAHYARYFGNTFAGFFSDEPSFRNKVYKQQRFDNGYYDARIGKHALALPWNEEVLRRMREKLGYDPMPHLNLLWYEDDRNGDDQAELRHAYMDTITQLYSECFTGQLADWCHAHGVEYIGHTLEDMNCHLRDGVSHYFRALERQDMSGIDIVMHHVLPGLEDYLHTALCAQGVAGGDFYHYILAKLGASLAHITPAMKGRAFCEIFGAYGFGEDSALMKYLVDHMLVRGINYFVPHAFSPTYPDTHAAPNFDAEGHDPSFEAFGELMRYTNKAAHLLQDAVHVANAAILYHMNGEWASRFENAMTMQPIATRLYDAHIDYDILPVHILTADAVAEGKLCIHKERYDCLIVPYADHMAKEVIDLLLALQARGLKVFFMQAMPENAPGVGQVLDIEQLVPTLRALGMTDVIVPDGSPRLRVYHCRREEADIYMFFNEDYRQTFDDLVQLPSRGSFARLDLLKDFNTSGSTADGKVKLTLPPNGSQILVFGDTGDLPPEDAYIHTQTLPYAVENFSLALSGCNELGTYRDAGTHTAFFNVTGPDHYPDFSGKMRYRFSMTLSETAHRTHLDLGLVGQNAELRINGQPCGLRICPPYVFDITAAVHAGENQVEIIVSNTLVQELRDHCSRFLQLAPSGLLGPLSLQLYRRNDS